MDCNAFKEGIREGFPIAAGYFAVSFSLGIIARNAGLNPIEGCIASFLNHASAGEYALYTSINNLVTFTELAIITFIVNARYLLMSFSLSQLFAPNTPMWHRFLVGFGITDEIYGITIARRGYLNTSFNYGAMAITIPAWTLGTCTGIIAGNVLPIRFVSALSVALYGMFIAIIIPPSRQNKVVAFSVFISFLFSYLFSILPETKELSSGTRTIILTIIISAFVAIIKPIKKQEDDD